MIHLAIETGKKRQSPRTGFIHFQDTIPLFENFCFAMALLRHHTVEAVLEGKELIGRLSAFQAPDGNFPIHIHEFPRCYDPWMGLKLAPILKFAKCVEALDKVLQNVESKKRPPLWEHRYQKLQKNNFLFNPTTGEEWYHWLISEQLDGPITLPIPYYPGLQVFVGGEEVQEKDEPKVHPIEWLFVPPQGRHSSDHPLMLHTAPLFPIDDPKIFEETSHVFCKERLLWKGSKLHSLSFPNGKLDAPNQIVFSLEDISDADSELTFFCNISSETDVTIGGKKGMVFYLGDFIEISTPALKIRLMFELTSGTGDFCGHISRANRPSQVSKEPYAVYDWQIALRTLRRSTPCKITVAIDLLID